MAVAMVIGGLMAVLQSGYPVTSAVLGDGSAFLANGTTVVHVNGESRRADAQLPDHLAKSGEGLTLAGLPNGQLAVVNDATDVLTTVDGSMMGITGTVRPGQSKPGSVRVVAADPNRWWIDIAAGDIALLDASGHTTPPVSVGGPIIDTAPGSEGSLLLLTADGTVIHIDSHLQPTTIPVTGGRGGALAFAGGATFLVSAGGSVLALAGDQPGTVATVPDVGPGPDGHVNAGSTASPADHVLIIADDSLIVLDAAAGRSQASALHSGSAMLGRPVELNGRAYIPDYTHHRLLVVDETTGALGSPIPVPGTAETFTLFASGHRVWANDQYNQFALVIDNTGDSHLVNKSTDSTTTSHPTTMPPSPTPSKQATSQPRTPSQSPGPQRSSGPRPAATTTGEPAPATSSPAALAQFHAAHVLTGHQGSVWSVAFQPGNDGVLASGGGGDRTVRLWDTVRGQQVKIVDTTGGSVSDLAFSPDGRVLAAAMVGYKQESGEIRLWSMATGELVMSPLTLHQNKPVSDVAFSPDGKLAASGGGDGAVRLWNPANGTPIGQPILISPQYAGITIAVAFSREGILAYSDGYDIVLWNPAAGVPIGKPLKGHSAQSVTSLAFSPDGRILASAGDDVRLWDVPSGTAIGTPTAHVGSLSVEFSPDGDTLAAVGTDYKIRLWNTRTGAPQQPPLTSSDCDMDVAFNTSGTMLAAACGLGGDKVRTWAR